MTKRRRIPQGKKLVRIDHKTEIEVSIDIPDGVARENYLRKLQPNTDRVRKPNQKK
jgi:hypothetical protein